ncbi:early activation antigen CD69-like isoform X2 [Prinia subflava]|uniref:early activation antigen CD69-like isoform X2 n=1 Tax=Prinia subflava TaxID=208062 RepID=UPI002FE264CA
MAARGGLCPRKALSPPCPEGKPFPPFAASPWPKSPVRGRARAGPEARNAERDGPRSPLSAPERGVAQCPWAPSRQDRAAASSPREAEPDPQLLLSGTRQLPGAVTAGPGPGLVCSHLPRAQEATCPKQEGATAECAVNEDVGNEFCSSTGSAKQPPNSQNRSEAVNARKKPRQFLGERFRSHPKVALVLALLVLLVVALVLALALRSGGGQTNIPVAAGTRQLLACPDGWIGSLRTCSFLWKDQRTWAQGQAGCSELGASLAVLRDEEMEFLFRLSGNVDYWLGLCRRGEQLQWEDSSSF